VNCDDSLETELVIVQDGMKMMGLGIGIVESNPIHAFVDMFEGFDRNAI
jgi:hypothetical protein